MQLEELLKTFELSQRSFNLCTYNNINSVKELIEYFLLHKTFKKLRNCGNKSNNELIEICKYYLEFDEYKQLIICNAENQTQINSNENSDLNLNRVQRETINDFIDVNINYLSKRSKNAILLHLENNIKIKNLIKNDIFSISFNASKIKNVGNRCIPEINEFVSTIKDFVFEVSKIENEYKLYKLKNKYLVQRTFSIVDIPNEIIEKQSIFKLTDYLINNYFLYKARDTVILKDCLYLFLSEESKDLNEIAKKHNLTRQRIEGIRKEGLSKLFERLFFLKNYIDESFAKKDFVCNNNLIDVSDDIASSLNYENETNFTKQFIIYIVYVHLSDKLALIGNIEDVLQHNYINNRTRHNWKNFYLINNEIISDFNFSEFVNDIDKRLNARIIETYEFNFKSYLSKFLINYNIERLEEIFEVAEKIVNKEFNIYLDLDDNIVFERNTIKQVNEYAIDILEEIGKPTKIDKIYELLEHRNPGITKSVDALRGSLHRSPKIKSFSRSSTFGLEKWEKEKENIKAGSIKDLVLDYLDQKDDPIHINQILSEVKKYGYETNAKNVITNIKLDPYKKFIIFNQSFIGLKNKNYETNLTALPKFLGKSITFYVKSNQNIQKQKVLEYFANKLEISIENMNYILEYLIDNQFINITNQNELTI